MVIWNNPENSIQETLVWNGTNILNYLHKLLLNRDIPDFLPIFQNSNCRMCEYVLYFFQVWQNYCFSLNIPFVHNVESFYAQRRQFNNHSCISFGRLIYYNRYTILGLLFIIQLQIIQIIHSGRPARFTKLKPNRMILLNLICACLRWGLVCWYSLIDLDNMIIIVLLFHNKPTPHGRVRI